MLSAPYRQLAGPVLITGDFNAHIGMIKNDGQCQSNLEENLTWRWSTTLGIMLSHYHDHLLTPAPIVKLVHRHTDSIPPYIEISGQ